MSYKEEHDFIFNANEDGMISNLRSDLDSDQDWFFSYKNERKQLVEMLFETGKRLRQTQSTVFLAISYMDEILNSKNFISDSVEIKSFKTISLVCLNIASKLDAPNLNTPIISELHRASGWYINYSVLVAFEREWLKILDWNLNRTTLYHWMHNARNLGFLYPSDSKVGGGSIDQDLDSTLYRGRLLIDYFTDILIKDSDFIKFKSSLLAAAWMCAIRMWLNIEVPWNSDISESLMYSKTDINPPLSLIQEKYGYLIETAGNIWSPPNCENSESKNACDHSLADIEKKVAIKRKILDCLYSYYGKLTSRVRTCQSVYSSEEDEEIQRDVMDFSEDSSEEEYPYFYDESCLPYDLSQLNEEDLTILEQTLHQNMYEKNPLNQIRSSSTGIEWGNSYKAKISSLLGAKAIIEGKENLEDLNHWESPLFDYYKQPIIFTEVGGKQKLPSEHHFSENPTDSSNVHEEDEKMQKKRWKRKEKKKKRKMKKQTQKLEQEGIDMYDNPNVNKEVVII
jgi:hypothetical protein